MISSLGKGLNILIKAKYTKRHDWQAFASWYSIFKNLPDAKVKVCCELPADPEYQLFNWPARCKVDFSFHYKKDDHYLEINPNIMAVYQYDENNLGPIDAKINEQCTFVDYSKGCGLFTLEKFKDYCPFELAMKLFSNDMSLNEYRILKIWDKANKTYISTV